jgi:hypothetical protein
MRLDGAYRAPRWLGGGGALGGNAQTIWPALASRRHHGTAARYRRQRIATPDGDFIDIDWQDAARTQAPLLVLFHGLEGSSASHYAEAFAATAAERGWRYAVPHFRGCSGAPNLAPRAYHSGDFEEVGWMLARCREAHRGPIVAVGVSLGGNALMRWVEEAGETASRTLRAVAAVSAPLDLAASGAAIGRGFNRLVYTRMFLASMRPKALATLARHPGLFDRQRLLAARDLHDFDDVFTAPLHGFRDADDYWARASCGPWLKSIAVPSLIVNARNDPFMPPAVLDALQSRRDIPAHVRLEFPDTGGHAGFPGRGRWLARRVLEFLAA